MTRKQYLSNIFNFVFRFGGGMLVPRNITEYNMTDNIVIRQAIESDAPMMHALQKKYIPNPAGSGIPESYFVALIKDGFNLVAEQDGQVIGFVSGERLIDGGAFVQFRAVDEKYQGRGIGRALADRFEQVLKDNGVHWLFSYAVPKVAEFHKRRGAHVGCENYHVVLKDL
jgi:ribosomal protein S18 acetylase RimI-like enzyme